MASDRSAIITGAGSGIGQATALLLRQAGYRLALVGRHEAKLRATADQLGEGSHADQLLIVAADVADPASPAKIIEAARARFGRVDALVNNAAAAPVAPIEQTDHAMLADVFAANMFGPALLVARLWPIFLRQRGGRVVNVSSMATVDPFPGLSAYAATKAALESLTRSIMNEGRHHGIRAFSVAPGAVETAMLRSAFPASVVPTERTLDPMQVARVIVDCILGKRDDEAGQTILLPSP